ncbi:MAG: hypothetical protein AAGF97_16845 [Planctomycetota bacterium]
MPSTHPLDPAGALRSLIERSLAALGGQRPDFHIDEVERAYQQLPRTVASPVSIDELLSLKYLLAGWRRLTGHHLIHRAEVGDVHEFRWATAQLAKLSWLVRDQHIHRLMTAYRRLSGKRDQVRATLVSLLQAQGDPDCVRDALIELQVPVKQHQLGPRRLRRRIRPYATTRFKRADQWLGEPDADHTHYRFEDTDTIHMRGMRMKTGDVILADLALPHEGLLNAYVHPRSHYTHSGMFLVVRYQGRHIPAVLEMHERGARLVPLNRFLAPTHTYYGEVYRSVSHPPADWAAALSQQALRLVFEDPISYDFLVRPVEVIDKLPRGERCATCYSLMELMFLRTGVYQSAPTSTRVCEKAITNMLNILGMAEVSRTFSNTTEMVRSGAELVGVFDNDAFNTNLGREFAIGHIDVEGSLAYQIGLRKLRTRNVQDFDWWFSQLVGMSQQDNLTGQMLRSLKGHTLATIPTSATPAAVAFYLAANRRLGPLVEDFVHSALFMKAVEAPLGCRLETLAGNGGLLELLKTLSVKHHVDKWF